MFKVFRLKSIIMAICLIVVGVFFSFGIVQSVGKDSPKYMYTIVLDAGHGGRDDGCSGVSGTKESEINLKITKKLEEYLKTLGIQVVLTRSDGNGLYDANVDNYKLSDM